MVEIYFGDWDDVMRELRRSMREADARVRPAQADIRTGQCYIKHKPEYGLFIFGRILDIGSLGYDKEEQQYIDETYSQAHMKYYRPVEAFSLACPYGERGDVHLSDIDAIIDKELFDWYKQHGWTKPRFDR